MLLFFLFIIFLILILLLSKIKIVFDKFVFEKNSEGFKFEYDGRVRLYFFGIRLLSFKVNNKKFGKVIEKNVSNFRQRQGKKISYKEFKVVKDFLVGVVKELKLERFKLKVLVDLKDVVRTSYLVGGLSVLISNVVMRKIERYEKKYCEFEVLPLYKSSEMFFADLRFVVSISVVSVLKVLFEIGRNFSKIPKNF